MEKEFIPYEQALALKELGFDESCFAVYKSNGDLGYFQYFNINRFIEDASRESNYSDLLSIECSAPLYQQAFRWFREKHNIDSYHIEPTNNMFSNFYGVLGLRTATFNGGFKTYEEAELACLKKLIEIVKRK